MHVLSSFYSFVIVVVTHLLSEIWTIISFQITINMSFSFSTRFNEFYKNSTDEDDVTILGHAKYGEMKACAEWVTNGVGNHPPLVRDKPGRWCHHNHSKTLSFVNRCHMALLFGPWCRDHYRWRGPNQFHQVGSFTPTKRADHSFVLVWVHWRWTSVQNQQYTGYR